MMDRESQSTEHRHYFVSPRSFKVYQPRQDGDAYHIEVLSHDGSVIGIIRQAVPADKSFSCELDDRGELLITIY